MGDPLHIRATAPLLEGWCGPVVAHDCDGDAHRCVSLGWSNNPHIPGAWVFDEADTDSFRENEDEPGPQFVSDVHLLLDLSRAECRDRVCRVLAARFGLLPGAAWLTLREGRREAYWPVYSMRADNTPVYGTSVEVIPTHAVLSTQPRIGRTSASFGALPVPYKHGEYFDGVVPALAALDPNDDARLPDGSRLVDALALAAVWRHYHPEEP